MIRKEAIAHRFAMEIIKVRLIFRFKRYIKRMGQDFHRRLTIKMKEKFTLATDTVYEDEKYEKRREMLRKIFRAVDKDMNRELG